jgi:hypothetical protein
MASFYFKADNLSIQLTTFLNSFYPWTADSLCELWVAYFYFKAEYLGKQLAASLNSFYPG